MKVRITKYDPKLRNKDGAFIGEDWTSVSDIGKFPGLTVEKYLRAEDGYWQTLASILDFQKVDKLRIGGVDFFDKQPKSNTLSLESWKFCRDLTLKELNTCDLQTAERLFRAALREEIWFRAFGKDGHDICAECGYDFYMYFASSADFRWAEIPGIFVEEMASDALE